MVSVNKNNVEIFRINFQKRIKSYHHLTVLCPSEVMKTIPKAHQLNNHVECVTNNFEKLKHNKVKIKNPYPIFKHFVNAYQLIPLFKSIVQGILERPLVQN